jgi:hypothetical protein|tara:strand:+ start:372 stop:566 length:195 start_codon:yes stop_codon:yes gene_type:complete
MKETTHYLEEAQRVWLESIKNADWVTLKFNETICSILWKEYYTNTEKDELNSLRLVCMAYRKSK